MNVRKIIFWVGMALAVLIALFTLVTIFLFGQQEKKYQTNRTQKAREQSIANAEARRKEKQQQDTPVPGTGTTQQDTEQDNQIRMNHEKAS